MLWAVCLFVKRVRAPHWLQISLYSRCYLYRIASQQSSHTQTHIDLPGTLPSGRAIVSYCTCVRKKSLTPMQPTRTGAGEEPRVLTQSQEPCLRSWRQKDAEHLRANLHVATGLCRALVARWWDNCTAVRNAQAKMIITCSLYICASKISGNSSLFTNYFVQISGFYLAFLSNLATKQRPSFLRKRSETVLNNLCGV